METQRILMRSLAIAVVLAAVIWTTTAQYHKTDPKYSCCTKVSTSEVTDPIISFRMLKENLPCVKAVIFETERGEFCSDWRQPWVKRKIRQFLKDKPKYDET
ncbi:eotaxin-like isoform X1 [Labeo rohita]|uniref:Eotaxin-like isoform X1 n=1 Tax=Labeo rohita TaxID=84645 RepID=A0A498P0X1_LABRO|nr:eotaxin-like isoform X1 [Labeo rohita]